MGELTKRSYTPHDIKVLGDNDHALLYPEMYIGAVSPIPKNVHVYSADDTMIFDAHPSFSDGLYKIFEEVVANGIDEHFKGTATRIDIEVSDDNRTIRVRDNGMGIPIGDHPELGIPTPQVVLTRLKSGSNFGKHKIVSTLGLFGVGVSLTNIFSSHLTVSIRRVGQRYHQVFAKNATVISKPKITKSTGPSFTEITFTPDFSRFAETAFDRVILRKIVRDWSYIFPQITFTMKFGGDRVRKVGPCQFKKFVDAVAGGLPYVYGNLQGGGAICHIAIVARDDDRFGDIEQISSVNGALLWRGGCHCDTLMDRLVAELRPRLSKTLKLDIKPKDIQRNLFPVMFLTVPNPVYEGQAKDRLIGVANVDTAEYFGTLFKKVWMRVAANEGLVEFIADRARERLNVLKSRKLKQKERKVTKRAVARLVPCSTKKREQAKLYIVEGLSALSNGTYVRDPKTMAFFPLQGKPLNAFKRPASAVLANKELGDLINVLGLSVTDKSIDSLQYGKIYIVSDQDEDGGHIRSLLTLFFYRYWPELFTSGKLAVLESPRYVILMKNGTRRYMYDDKSFDKFIAKTNRKRYNGVRYIKGLGGLEQQDWSCMLFESPIVYDLVIDNDTKSTIDTVFGDDVQVRKDWLSNEHI